MIFWFGVVSFHCLGHSRDEPMDGIGRARLRRLQWLGFGIFFEIVRIRSKGKVEAQLLL